MRDRLKTVLYNIFMNLLTAYLIIMNTAGFILFGMDKSAARRGAWRIPESILMLIAAIGGCLGCFLGMHAFHHKTRHAKFRIGLPLILICWAALIVFILLH